MEEGQSPEPDERPAVGRAEAQDLQRPGQRPGWEQVAAQVGKPFAPARVIRVAQLPKTRSAKILRRAVRAAVLDADPGDLSGAENPEAVEDIRSQVKELRG